MKCWNPPFSAAWASQVISVGSNCFIADVELLVLYQLRMPVTMISSVVGFICKYFSLPRCFLIMISVPYYLFLSVSQSSTAESCQSPHTDTAHIAKVISEIITAITILLLTTSVSLLNTTDRILLITRYIGPCTQRTISEIRP